MNHALYTHHLNSGIRCCRFAVCDEYILCIQTWRHNVCRYSPEREKNYSLGNTRCTLYIQSTAGNSVGDGKKSKMAKITESKKVVKKNGNYPTQKLTINSGMPWWIFAFACFRKCDDGGDGGGAETVGASFMSLNRFVTLAFRITQTIHSSFCILTFRSFRKCPKRNQNEKKSMQQSVKLHAMRFHLRYVIFLLLFLCEIKNGKCGRFILFSEFLMMDLKCLMARCGR